MTDLTHYFSFYVHFYSLHVSGSHVPIIRRIIVSTRHVAYVTACRWPSGMQVRMLAFKSAKICQLELHMYKYTII